MLPLYNFTSLTMKCRPTLTNYMSVRWKRRPRKPLFLGMAKTKLFKIPEKTHSEEDRIELERMMEAYDRHMRAFQNFWSIDSCTKMKSQMELEDVMLIVSDSLRMNAKWNETTALLRMERLEREKADLKERILEQTMADKNMDAYLQYRADELVQREIEESKHFVTEENLDEMVEKCLSSITDYNCAIDLSGNIYKGTSKSNITGKMTPNQPNDLDIFKQVTSEANI